MSRLSKKSLLLFGAAMAVCAFVMPSVASAAQWHPVNTTHVLDSNNLSFSVAALGSGSVCNNSRFHVDVASTSDIRVTGASFSQCHGLGAAVNCTTTATPTNVTTWTGTPLSTTNVTIDRVHVDILFENTPGAPAACPLLGAQVTLTGSLAGGEFNNASHHLTFAADAGLFSHTVGGATNAATISGTFRDTQQTLIMTD